MSTNTAPKQKPLLLNIKKADKEVVHLGAVNPYLILESAFWAKSD